MCAALAPPKTSFLPHVCEVLRWRQVVKVETMKALLGCAAVLIAGLASGANAANPIEFEGAKLSIPELMEKCSRAEGGSEAQLKCYALLAQALKEQENAKPAGTIGVSPAAEKLEALRSVAEYQDAESGLTIVGEGCQVAVFYYGNYYRISRRNVSSIDLIHAQFDASKMQYGQMSMIQGPSMTMIRGVVDGSSPATNKGGLALESVQHGFASKSAGQTIDEYANQVVSQLPGRSEQTFDFVLVHPKKAAESNEILNAFALFVQACTK